MCLILFSFRAHEEFPLVVAANRDERFQRATQLAQFWPEAPELMAGRDLEAGGTWLGITRQGRFAAITNFRGHASSSNPLSRGQLASQFLLSNLSVHDYANAVLANSADYQGFNLLLFDGQEFGYCNNLNHHQSQTNLTILKAGVYGLSNGVLNAPWPKIEKGKRGLQELLSNHQSSKPLHTESLLQLLHDDKFADDHTLPNTGIELSIERQLSPLFITASDHRGQAYGTCNSTAIIVNRQQEVTFHERSFYQPPIQQNPIDQIFNFCIEK